MYYLLIPVLSFLFFMKVFSFLSAEINHRFKNFDYKYSISLRSNLDLESYINNLDPNILDNENEITKNSKIFPPYSDYNINQKFDSKSSALTLFSKD